MCLYIIGKYWGSFWSHCRFPTSWEWSNCWLGIIQLESSQDFLKIIALINGDTSSSTCDVHVQKLLNISEILAFPFSHKESLLFFDKFFVLAEEHSIIYIVLPQSIQCLLSTQRFRHPSLGMQRLGLSWNWIAPSTRQVQPV